MDSTQRSVKITAILSIASGIFALLCVIAGLEALNYNFEAFADPYLILVTPGVSAVAARWSMLFDMLGYYLLLLPAIFYIHHWLKSKTEWASLLTFLATSYVMIGSIGAAVLSVIWPQVISSYPTASEQSQEIIKANFNLVNAIVYDGLWNTLEVLLAGVWWFFLGFCLQKNHPGFGRFTILLGLSCLLDAIGNILSVKGLAELGLNLYLVLAILWPVWFGVLILKKRL